MGTYQTAATLLKQLGMAVSTGLDDIDFLLRTRVVRCHFPADMWAVNTVEANQAASQASLATEHVLLNTEKAIVITKCTIMIDDDIVADNTDFVTWALQVGDQADGALGTAIASKTSKAASLNGPADFTLTTIYSDAGGTAVAAGKRVSLNVTKGGAGKVVPNMIVELTYLLD